MESFDAFMGSKMGFLSVAFVNIFVFQRKGKVGSSVVSRNFLFVGVGWVLFFYTFSSDTSMRGRSSYQRTPGMETFDAFILMVKNGFSFRNTIKHFCKEKAKDGIEEQSILEFLYM